MSNIFSALTIWQPWATLIAIGAKPYEFRGHERCKSLVGQRIAVHAGQHLIPPAQIRQLLKRLEHKDGSVALHAEIAIPYLESMLADPNIVPRGCVVATALLGPAKSGQEVAAEFGSPYVNVNDSERDEHSMFAWPMLDVIQLQPPIEAKGAQGFWKWGAPEWVR